MNKEQLEKVKDLFFDLGWEVQRMSSSGRQQYNEICELLGLEPYEEF